MPAPGCKDCKRAKEAFADTTWEGGGGGDPLEWAEYHLRYHDRRTKLYRNRVQ